MQKKKRANQIGTKLSITAVVIAKNEASMIANCLETLRWCDSLLVIDNGSTDQTASIAEGLGAKVITFKSDDFASLRNAALKYVKTDWLLYLDADERITTTLYQEIAVNVETEAADVLQMKRENICYGTTFKHGGWQNDIVTRIFKTEALEEWTGSIHESAQYKGSIKMLHTSLLHLTHRSTQDNLYKSAEWTIKEARLLAESGLPPVTFKTLLRKGVMEFVRRAFIKGGSKDGVAGMIESLVQAMNRVMVYIQVWELQQQPPLAEQYHQIENEIANQWNYLHKLT